MKQNSGEGQTNANSIADMYDVSKLMTTGNKFKDALIGGGAGLGEALNPEGRYVPYAQWAGNGLANTGIRYLRNPDKRDYTSGGLSLMQRLRKLNNNNNTSDSSGGLTGSIAPFINSYIQNGMPIDIFNGGNDMSFLNAYSDGSSAIGSCITDYVNGSNGGGAISDYLSSMFSSDVPSSIF